MHKPVRLALLSALVGLTACGDGGWFSGPAKRPLQGERLAVMQTDRSIEPDQRLSSLAVKLPPQFANAEWPQPGGYTGEYISHPAADGFTVAWRVSLGDGNSRSGRVSAPPVVAQGRVYAMDASATLNAIDAESGRTLWRFDVRPDNERSGGGSGGGAAVEAGKVYVATGYAQIIALDAETSKEAWRTTLSAPFRANPTTGGGRVFAVSNDNQIHALDAATGRKLWSHSGITESAGLYGGSSPILAGNILIAGLSSGEVFALRADNGRVLWSDSLAAVARTDAVSSLADLRGFPVVDRGRVTVASHAGRLADIDLRSGARIWEQSFGSFNTPWVAGDFMFLITIDSELLCISRRDGRVRWVQPLRKWRDTKDKKGRIVWTGPILAGGRLLLANDDGEGLIVSPEDGETAGTLKFSGPVSVLPIVANRTIFVVTDTGDLVALR
jgi:outer membrane protein assembly factor BamB